MQEMQSNYPDSNEFSALPTNEVEETFKHGSVREINETLVTLALYDPHWQLVERYCLQFLDADDAQVRAVAATCIGHLARIHKQLDMDLVLPALQRHLADPDKWVVGNVDNALDDIQIFMRAPVSRNFTLEEMDTESALVDDEDAL